MSNIINKSNKKEKIKDWHILEFFVPIETVAIEESLKEGFDPDFLIRGVAINETTTLNNVKYISEELQKAAISFRNVPVLLDHKNEIKNIVGRTTEKVDFNIQEKRIDYEAKIMDNQIKEMIKDGRIQNVSIGAKVDDLIEEEDGSMKAIGIYGLELSLVAVPGDNHASLGQALQNSFMLKEMAMKEETSKIDKQLNTEVKQMAEDKIKSDEQEAPTEKPAEESAVEVPKEEEKPVEEPKEDVAAEKSEINIKLDSSELTEMKVQIKELKELLLQKKQIKEDMEEDKKEVKDETKGEVSSEKEKALEKVDNLIVEQAKQGFAIYRNYNNESSDTKLNRLVR